MTLDPKTHMLFLITADRTTWPGVLVVSRG